MASSRFAKTVSAVAVALGVTLGTAELLVVSVAEHEGEVLSTYQDIVGVNTVCFGDTDPAFAVPGATYTPEECLESLARQIIKHARPVIDCLPGVEQSDGMLAAFGSLAFNIGAERFCASTAAKRFRAGDYAGSCAAIEMWNKAGGRTVKGLARRRAAERAVCERGILAMRGAGGVSATGASAVSAIFGEDSQWAF